MLHYSLERRFCVMGDEYIFHIAPLPFPHPLSLPLPLPLPLSLSLPLSLPPSLSPSPTQMPKLDQMCDYEIG